MRDTGRAGVRGGYALSTFVLLAECLRERGADQTRRAGDRVRVPAVCPLVAVTGQLLRDRRRQARVADVRDKEMTEVVEVNIGKLGGGADARPRSTGEVALPLLTALR